MLPNPFVPSSFGIDNLERGLLWAVLLLAATAGPIQIGFDPDTVALSARLPVQDPQLWYQDPLAAVGAIDSALPSLIPAASLPSLTTRDPAPPATVETVEQFLVFCAQGLGQELMLEAGSTVLIQARIPYDRSLWLYRGGVLDALRSSGVDHCAGFGGVSSDLSGAGYLRPAAPDLALANCIGSGSLLCLSAVSSNLGLFGSGELSAFSGVPGMALALGAGSLDISPPLPAVSDVSGSGSLELIGEPSADLFGIGTVTASTLDPVANLFGSGSVDSAAGEDPQPFPIYGRSYFLFDAFVASSDLSGAGSLDGLIPGEVINLVDPTPADGGGGTGLLTASAGEFLEAEIIGAGSLSLEVIETAAELFGSGSVSAVTDDRFESIGIGFVAAEAVVIVSASIFGAGSVEAITFGDGASAVGLGSLSVSAPLTSNLDLFGAGFLLAETEEREACRVPCGSVSRIDKIRFVELRLGSVEELV